ncbi:MAG: VCBS repeat-containing protein [Myxococcales bacterium]|nr:VCBS repeat-containing protein [Myxococcales bacterium]
MSSPLHPAGLLGAALGVACAAGCFAPQLNDGEIACGTAGCPDGMSCGGDGYCYTDPAPSERHVAVVVANDGAPDRVYAYCGNTLREVWSSPDARATRAVAVGDADGDRIPEVAFSTEEDGIGLFRFDGPALTQVASVWLPDIARDLAWGNVDDDGRPDLVSVGDQAPVRIMSYGRHDDFSIWWESDDRHDAFAIATADADGDGEDDLAVGSRDCSAIVYTTRGHGIQQDWSTDRAEDAITVAWADADGDGDPDLAVGASWRRLRLYANRGEWYEEIWSSPDDLAAESAAWADVDGDGDPDLALGTGSEQDLRLFRNDDGQLTQVWSSGQLEATQAIAWADIDGDGDADLVVGNDGSPSRLYRNVGGTLELAWSSSHADPTRDIAVATWGGGPDLCR